MVFILGLLIAIGGTWRAGGGIAAAIVIAVMVGGLKVYKRFGRGWLFAVPMLGVVIGVACTYQSSGLGIAALVTALILAGPLVEHYADSGLW